MLYKSTRGGATGTSFEEAISRGYAPDGGLFVPESLPRLSLDDLEKLRRLDFTSLAEAIIGLFVGDEELGPPGTLRDLLVQSYSGFDCDEIVPFQSVGDLFVSELFHGPTLCFKDLGQQPLVRMLALFASKRGIRRTMLVSTTGDTGPAAMRAVEDVGCDNLGIVVFFPKGQISDLQRRQMTTLPSRRAQVACFSGDGDDMDAPLKRIAADRLFAERHGLCGINSYNLGRPICQMVHHFWAYFRALDKRALQVGSAVDFVLPCGALGNLAAAYMARCMGLPIGRLTAGVNANDVTHRTFAFGEFHKSDVMHRTLSDAINIQVPYNMERILYYICDEDAVQTTSWMSHMDRDHKLTLPAPWLQRLQGVFGSSKVDDASMCAAVRRALDEHGYLADPHTAVALAAAWRSLEADASVSSTPVVVAATASPCKFEASLTEAIGARRWGVYAGGPEFPQAARTTMECEERAPLALAAATSGGLAASQVEWEAEVRGLLEVGLALAARAGEPPQSRL